MSVTVKCLLYNYIMNRIFKISFLTGLSLLLSAHFALSFETSYENFSPAVLKSGNQPFRQTLQINNNSLGNVFTYNLPTSSVAYPMEFVFQKSSFNIAFTDPDETTPGASAYYPGFRGANQLVIYTPAFGLRTGTNEYGAEAVVCENTVTKLTGANSYIPKNGFVISGHGKAKDWIQKNLTPGTKIYINPYLSTVTALTTASSKIYEVREKIRITDMLVREAMYNNIRYDAEEPREHLKRAWDYLDKAQKHPQKVSFYVEKAKEETSSAFKTALPYDANEFKGVWIRPTQKTDKDIEQTVKDLKKAGIDNVFLETFYHFQTIYPSNVASVAGIRTQRQEFVGFDPLKSWSEHCKKNGVKLHIWFECFYAGNVPPESSLTHVLTKHPDWANQTKATAGTKTIARSAAEHNGYFIDPANPEARQYLLDVLTEIITKYHPDGINLDYIRYPQGVAKKTDGATYAQWGYTDFARNEFKSYYGTDPLTVSASNPVYDCWIKYRQNKITSFLSQVQKITKANNITLTTVIFPDKNNAKISKLQDWQLWANSRLVDGFTPLILTVDENIAAELIRQVTSTTQNKISVYPGIFVPFMDASFENLIMQIRETRKQKTQGVILFDYAHLKQEYKDALSRRVFNPKS